MTTSEETRRCSRCGEVQPIMAFRWRRDRQRYAAWCRSCKRAYDRDWYRRNRESHKQAVRALRREQVVANVALVRRAKSVPCADCGASCPHYVMDFDHVRGTKTGTIGRMVSEASTPRLLGEIAKCEVVCANCHRERSFGSQARPQSELEESGGDTAVVGRQGLEP